MAIALVQSKVFAKGTGTRAVTFDFTPAVGNFIGVLVSSYRNGNGYGIGVADGRNGYTLAANSGDSNGDLSCIFYTYNIATGSPFTVTITPTIGSTETMGCIMEFSGFGATNPLVGAAAVANANPPTSTTGPIGGSIPEVLCLACMSTFRLNFDIVSITVGAATPAYNELYEFIANGTPFTGSFEGDWRINNVTPTAAQSVTWTLGNLAPGNPSSAIACFYNTPPTNPPRVTQFAREVVEFDGTVNARLTQFSREIVYPFTCGTSPPSGASLLLKADTDLDGLGGGGGGGGAFPYQGTGGDDDSEQYMAFVKTRAYSPGGDINRLGTAGQVQQPLVVTKRAQTAFQLEIDRNRGAELQTSYVDLTAEGSETRCIRKFENAQLADAATLQFKLGDIFNNLNRWSIDRFQVKQSADGDK